MTLSQTPVHDPLDELLARREPGHSLEAAFYTSQDIFDIDVRRVFAQHWIFAGTAAEIREPGDFFTVSVGPWSVIVLRDDDEQVRALHNVCRHRGARVLTEPRGSVGNIVCGYHRWTYATDGSLLHAESQPRDFDPSCFGLKQVHVRDIAGLIFICLSEEPPSDLDEVAEVITPYLIPHQLERTKVAAQVDIVEQGNWKLVMENNRECYHCDGHPELIASLFPLFGYAEDDITPRLRPVLERYERAKAEMQDSCRAVQLPTEVREELDNRPTGYRVERMPLDLAGESYGAGGARLCQKLLGDLTTARLGDLSLHMQPNSWFHFLADHAVTFSVIPLSAGETLLRTTWLVHEDAVEGTDYDVDALTAVWRATNAQDSALVARTHAGVSSPAYVGGPYSPTENHVEAFVSWYLQRLRQATA
jgi:Rieske 2Fe-2S family protein